MPEPGSNDQSGRPHSFDRREDRFERRFALHKQYVRSSQQCRAGRDVFSTYLETRPGDTDDPVVSIWGEDGDPEVCPRRIGAYVSVANALIIKYADNVVTEDVISDKTDYINRCPESAGCHSLAKSLPARADLCGCGEYGFVGVGNPIDLHRYIEH